MVERGNRQLEDALRTLLVGNTHDDWDRMLPHIMRAVRGMPHSITKETPNCLTYGREPRIPDQLAYHIPVDHYQSQDSYAAELLGHLTVARNIVSETVWVRTYDKDDTLLYKEDDLVWLQNTRRRKGESPKLQAKFVGPYAVQTCYKNHTYEICRHGQVSLQNEGRLKLYHSCAVGQGKAPVTLEAVRRPNMESGYRPNRRERPEEITLAYSLPLDRPDRTNTPARALPPARGEVALRDEEREETEDGEEKTEDEEDEITEERTENATEAEEMTEEKAQIQHR